MQSRHSTKEAIRIQNNKHYSRGGRHRKPVLGLKPERQGRWVKGLEEEEEYILYKGFWAKENVALIS